MWWKSYGIVFFGTLHKLAFVIITIGNGDENESTTKQMINVISRHTTESGDEHPFVIKNM